MGQINCGKCKRWGDLGENTRYCTWCACPLYADDLGELPKEAEQANQEYLGVRVSAQSGGRIGFFWGFALAFLLMQGGFIGEFLGYCTILCSGIAGIILGSRKRSKLLKAIAIKYERIWSMPTLFRPTLSKETLLK